VTHGAIDPSRISASRSPTSDNRKFNHGQKKTKTEDRGRKADRDRKASSASGLSFFSYWIPAVSDPTHRKDITGNAPMQIHFQTMSWIIQFDPGTFTGLNTSQIAWGMPEPQNLPM
jgi:hypothetical protein